MAGFEIATASANDVRQICDWAKDEGWSPGRTDHWAFHAADPSGFLMGRLDGVVVISGVVDHQRLDDVEQREQ